MNFYMIWNRKEREFVFRYHGKEPMAFCDKVLARHVVHMLTNVDRVEEEDWFEIVSYAGIVSGPSKEYMDWAISEGAENWGGRLLAREESPGCTEQGDQGQ